MKWSAVPWTNATGMRNRGDHRERRLGVGPAGRHSHARELRDEAATGRGPRHGRGEDAAHVARHPPLGRARHADEAGEVRIGHGVAQRGDGTHRRSDEHDAIGAVARECDGGGDVVLLVIPEGRLAVGTPVARAS